MVGAVACSPGTSRGCTSSSTTHAAAADASAAGAGHGRSGGKACGWVEMSDIANAVVLMHLEIVAVGLCLVPSMIDCVTSSRRELNAIFTASVCPSC